MDCQDDEDCLVPLPEDYIPFRYTFEWELIGQLSVITIIVITIVLAK